MILIDYRIVGIPPHCIHRNPNRSYSPHFPTVNSLRQNSPNPLIPYSRNFLLPNSLQYVKSVLILIALQSPAGPPPLSRVAPVWQSVFVSALLTHCTVARLLALLLPSVVAALVVVQEQQHEQ